MKIKSYYFSSMLCALLLILSVNLKGQGNWVSYSQKIDVKNYIGDRFRFHGLVRAEIADDSAEACLWVRVDKEKGYNFFDNMMNRPVRNKEWKGYSVEGKIESNSTQIVFGALCLLNGKFYYDDLKFEIETSKDKWITVFADDFEDNINTLVQGIQIGTSGFSPKFKAEIISDEKGQGKKCLVIEGKDIANYGDNKKVGKFADVNGIKLYYEIYGSGPPLVVLHGNGGSISSATAFYPELMKKYKVIAIDSRAQGKSGDTKAALTYEQMASDVNELLEQLKTDSVYVWGQSDGAILGLILAMDYPKKVKKVLAFGANIQPDSMAVFPWTIRICQTICKESKDAKEVKLNKLMLDEPNIPYSKLGKIKAPVLIMAGDRDMIRPEHTLKLFQNIPNSQMCILPGSTHGAAWENQELFLSIMNNFFNTSFTMPDTKDWFKE